MRCKLKCFILFVISQYVVANFSILERLKKNDFQNDECLSMYIINTIPYGKCFVREYAHFLFSYQKPHLFLVLTHSISDTSTTHA